MRSTEPRIPTRTRCAQTLCLFRTKLARPEHARPAENASTSSPVTVARQRIAHALNENEALTNWQRRCADLSRCWQGLASKSISRLVHPLWSNIEDHGVVQLCVHADTTGQRRQARTRRTGAACTCIFALSMMRSGSGITPSARSTRCGPRLRTTHNDRSSTRGLRVSAHRRPIGRPAHQLPD